MKTIALKILRYLIQYPGARDTIRGITKWWLLEQQMQEEGRKVKDVLDELVLHGFVVEHEKANDETEFSLNVQNEKKYSAW